MSSAGASGAASRATTWARAPLSPAWISSSKLMIAPVTPITERMSAAASPTMEWICSRAVLMCDVVKGSSLLPVLRVVERRDPAG